MKHFNLYILVLLMFCSCVQKIDYSKMDYKDIPSNEFEKLPYITQYKIKYKNVPDNVLLFECYVKDTLYFEDGTMKKTELVLDTFNIVFNNDSMLFNLKYAIKDPELSLSLSDEVYIEKEKRFSKYVTLKPKYDKNRKRYYLLRTDFPRLEKNSFGFSPISSVHFQFDLKNYDFELESRNNNFLFYFTESKIVYKGEYGKFQGKPFPEKNTFVCEQNQETSLIRWITQDNSYINVHTDVKK